MPIETLRVVTYMTLWIRRASCPGTHFELVCSSAL